MDTSPSAMLRFLVPKLPYLLKTAVLHSIWLSPTSTKWDLRTEIVVNIIRSLLNGSGNPSSLSKVQRISTRDPGVKGKMWVSRVTAPVPAEDDIRQVLFRAIDELKESLGESYAKPEVKPVEAEWTGYRADAGKDEPEPLISEAEKYKQLMVEVSSPVTILYFHGGAYYLMDPASHRPVVSKLAKLTKGRALNVRYRLSPQNPFPAALLDALLAYLYLLYPPPGSLHEPVPASNIVFAGDSAGGNLSLALLQLILQLHRSAPKEGPRFMFRGRQVNIPLPAGVATNSAWCDMTRCLPSLERNAHYDYLPPPSQSATTSFPPDDIWPTRPPRGDIYCESSMLCHPLVSPLACTPSMWAGTPPLLFLAGEEMLEDEIEVVTARAASQKDVIVKYELYEAMPHCFAMILEHLPASSMCFESWAAFMRECVEGKKMESEGKRIEAKSLKVTKLDLERLAEGLGEELVKERMRKAREAREKGEETEGKAAPLPKL